MKSLFSSLLLILLLPGVGAAFCLEPSEPSCLNLYNDFSSSEEGYDCKNDLEQYLDELADYARCLAQDIEDKQNEAIDAFNRRVNSDLSF